MSTLLRYMFLPLLVGFIIFIGTCVIGPESVPDLPSSLPWDKIAHFGMFFLLSAVSLLDYYKLHAESPPVFRWIFWGFVIPVIYGGVIEILQMYFFTSRNAETGDWLADIVGSATAFLLSITLLQKRNKRRKNISL